MIKPERVNTVDWTSHCDVMLVSVTVTNASVSVARTKLNRAMELDAIVRFRPINGQLNVSCDNVTPRMSPNVTIGAVPPPVPASAVHAKFHVPETAPIVGSPPMSKRLSRPDKLRSRPPRNALDAAVTVTFERSLVMVTGKPKSLPVHVIAVRAMTQLAP